MRSVIVIDMRTVQNACIDVGSTVRLRAHVHNARDMGNCCFLVLRSDIYTAQAAMFKSGQHLCVCFSLRF